MEDALNVVIGLVTTVLVGLSVGPTVRSVKDSMPLPPPSAELSDAWRELTTDPKCDKSGRYLGLIERLLFFASIWTGFSAVVVGWLAFKVASKWDVWGNVIAVPHSIESTSELGYLIARRRWGSQRLMTFLIGTGANLLSAFAGVAIGRHGYRAIKSLVC